MNGPIELFRRLFSAPDWLVVIFKILWPPALVLLLVWVLFYFYKRYIQERWISKIAWTLLEIRIPRDVPRSPEAMELVLHSMWQHGGVSLWTSRWLSGAVLNWFSLEIVSNGGTIHFYIRTPNKFRDFLVSQIYAQYPQAEIIDVDDYTRKQPLYDRDGDFQMFGSEFKLDKPDPYPIKTYVDFGLDKAVNLDEEQKIDPLNQVLEFMGSIGPGEQLWLQYIVRFHPKRYQRPGSSMKKQDWVAEAKALKKDLIKEFATRVDGDGNEKIDMSQLTAGEKKIIEAIERSTDKAGFDVGMRMIYHAPKENFIGNRIPAMLTVFKGFGSNDLNSIKPLGSTITDLDYPWEDFNRLRVEKRKQSMYKAYIERGYFYPPYYQNDRQPFVFNVEELATVFHFPSRATVTPGVERVTVRKAEPPVNLPY